MTHQEKFVNAANPKNENVICISWVVFSSGQGLRGEYKTTASASISAALEEEVGALCREFHHSLGIEEVPDGLPIVLFWKARQSAHWVVMQVLHAPSQPGQRIAYEYFSLALMESGLQKLGGNPLRALELVGIEQLRARYSAGLREPFDITITKSRAAASTPPTSRSFQNGLWPATQANRAALLSSIKSDGASARSFATWWPNATLPRSCVFDIVLHSEATRVARPQEILAIATELNRSLSRGLPAPPSYDAVGGRCYRMLLQSADEVQAMLNEAYFPAALEESPHRWMTRPQKLAGLCQKIADDLPDYAARLPAHFSEEIGRECNDLVRRYEDLASELQKLRHPNILQQSQKSITGTAKKAVDYQPNAASRAGHATPNSPAARPNNAQHRRDPWAEEPMPRPSTDGFIAQLGGTKSGYALESTASKFGSILVLLLISSVAAVGVFMSEEEQPLPRSGNVVSQSANTPRDLGQQAYDLAYQWANQRVKTARGLTRPQRLAAAREALAQVMGGNVARLDPAAILKLAKRAPENVKKAAFRGVVKGEAAAISAQSQLYKQ